MKMMSLNSVWAGERRNYGDILWSAHAAADSAQTAADADNASAEQKNAEDSQESHGSEEVLKVIRSNEAYQSEQNNDRAFECHPLNLQAEAIKSSCFKALYGRSNL